MDLPRRSCRSLSTNLRSTVRKYVPMSVSFYFIQEFRVRKFLVPISVISKSTFRVFLVAREVAFHNWRVSVKTPRPRFFLPRSGETERYETVIRPPERLNERVSIRRRSHRGGRFSFPRNNSQGSPGIAAAARERLGQPWGRGYDVLVINLFCALPATRRAETSFSRRIGLPPRHGLKNPPTAFGRITLPRRKLVALKTASESSLIPADLETSFGFSNRATLCTARSTSRFDERREPENYGNVNIPRATMRYAERLEI